MKRIEKPDMMDMLTEILKKKILQDIAKGLQEAD